MTYEVDSLCRQFANSSSIEACAIFAAAAVTRVAESYVGIVANIPGRSEDVDAYVASVEDLWASPLILGDRFSGFSERLMNGPEMSAEEEPPGILAYALDASVAAYYAARYRVDPDPDHIGSISSRVLNSAYFLDERIGGAVHYSKEEECQRRDIGLLSGEDLTISDIEEIKASARNVSRVRFRALLGSFDL